MNAIFATGATGVSPVLIEGYGQDARGTRRFFVDWAEEAGHDMWWAV